ncbi:hypothetical protein [Streptomyces sp. NPDC058291]|uniref:hypothetical protein n=1 Tax=Streptomyces sp. NPDC058291 TaxID=3346427 RepID=UPI0036EC77F0
MAGRLPLVPLAPFVPLGSLAPFVLVCLEAPVSTVSAPALHVSRYATAARDSRARQPY